MLTAPTPKGRYDANSPLGSGAVNIVDKHFNNVDNSKNNVDNLLISYLTVLITLLSSMKSFINVSNCQ